MLPKRLFRYPRMLRHVKQQGSFFGSSYPEPPRVMDVQIIGAGLPRTGTMSLKYAIEQLLSGSCYHMHELYQTPEHVGLWSRVLEGKTHLLTSILDGRCAALDWPVSAVWRDAMELFPTSKVLLSKRASSADWWESVDQTVWQIIRTKSFRFSSDQYEADAFSKLHEQLTSQFSPHWDDEDAAQAAYAKHLASVRKTVPKDRLIEFEIGDGWAPLCRALNTPEPTHPFPNKNNRENFKSRNAI